LVLIVAGCASFEGTSPWEDGDAVTFSDGKLFYNGLEIKEVFTDYTHGALDYRFYDRNNALIVYQKAPFTFGGQCYSNPTDLKCQESMDKIKQFIESKK
jgi:hypothetical protein